MVRIKPPLLKDCECEGFGYGVFDNDGRGTEINKHDDCTCLAERCEEVDLKVDDKIALHVFVLDIVNFRHGRHRQRIDTMARDFIDGDLGEGAHRS